MNFLDLPTDIRKKIWRLLLTRLCPVDFSLETIPDGWEDFESSCDPDKCSYLYALTHPRYGATGAWGNKRRCTSPLFQVQILRSCREVYREASEILYTENKFILTSQTRVTLPHVDLARLRSIHIHIPEKFMTKNALLEYQRMIEQVKLSPEARFTFTSCATNMDGIRSLARIIITLGPVQSCSIRLGSPLTAKEVATEMMFPKPPSEPTFSQYRKLPKELQLHILSYTDLTHDLMISHGRLHDSSTCCKQCCDTFLECCCKRRGFSLTCRCVYSPLPLFKVSREFRNDAIEVAFKKSLFEFRGPINVQFWRKAEPYLPMIRRINVMVDVPEVQQWESNAFLWYKFFDNCGAHLNLPLLSLTMVVDWRRNNLYGRRIGNLEWAERSMIQIENFYQGTVPGFGKLAQSGVRHCSYEFLQHDWDPLFKNLLEKRIMGQDYVKPWTSTRLDTE